MYFVDVNCSSYSYEVVLRSVYHLLKKNFVDYLSIYLY